MAEFHFKARTLALVYNRTWLTSQQILDCAYAWGGKDNDLQLFTIGSAAHTSDKRCNMLCYFSYTHTITTDDRHFFDIDGVCPSIGNKTTRVWEKQCASGKAFVTNYYELAPTYYTDRADVSFAEALEYHWRVKPEHMCKHGVAVQKRLRRRKPHTHARRRPAFYGPWPRAWHHNAWRTMNTPYTHSQSFEGWHQ